VRGSEPRNLGASALRGWRLTSANNNERGRGEWEAASGNGKHATREHELEHSLRVLPVAAHRRVSASIAHVRCSAVLFDREVELVTTFSWGWRAWRGVTFVKEIHNV